MCESDSIKLLFEEGFDVIGWKLCKCCRVGDAALDVLVDAEREITKKFGLCDKNEVVVLWGVFKQQPKFSECVECHEVRVINDNGEHLSSVVDFVSLFNESLFAPRVAAMRVDVECIAEDAQRARIGM